MNAFLITQNEVFHRKNGDRKRCFGWSKTQFCAMFYHPINFCLLATYTKQEVHFFLKSQRFAVGQNHCHGSWSPNKLNFLYISSSLVRLNSLILFCAQRCTHMWNIQTMKPLQFCTGFKLCTFPATVSLKYNYQIHFQKFIFFNHCVNSLKLVLKRCTVVYTSKYTHIMEVRDMTTFKLVFLL